MNKSGEAEEPPNLLRAAERNDEAELAKAIELGASLNEQYDHLDGMTVLHYACYRKKIAFVEAALEYEFDPWVTDYSGRRVIDVARAEGLTSIQQKILELMYPNGPGPSPVIEIG